jgi:hypothetical protein
MAIMHEIGALMSGLVIELQRDALDKSIAVSDLLRKALVVARKLRVGDLERWARNELEGYDPTEDVPKYRHVVGELKGLNRFHGWVPFSAPDNVMDKWTHRTVTQPLPELEATFEGGKSRGTFAMTMSPGQQHFLMQMTGQDSQFALFVPSGVLAGILSGARNAVLNWALELEERGILGEGMTFTQKEREAAAKTGASIVNNFYGDRGQSQVMNSSPGGHQTIKNSGVDFEAVRSLIANIKREQANLKLSEADGVELSAELITLEAQLSSPKPKSTIVASSIATIWGILKGTGVGAAGNVLAEMAKSLME